MFQIGIFRDICAHPTTYFITNSFCAILSFFSSTHNLTHIWWNWVVEVVPYRCKHKNAKALEQHFLSQQKGKPAITNYKCPSTTKTVRFSPLRNPHAPFARSAKHRRDFNPIDVMSAIVPPRRSNARSLIQSPNKHLSDISVCLLSITFHAATVPPASDRRRRGINRPFRVKCDSNLPLSSPRLPPSITPFLPAKSPSASSSGRLSLARLSPLNRISSILPADFPPFPRSSAPVIVVSMHSATTIHDCGDNWTIFIVH